MAIQRSLDLRRVGENIIFSLSGKRYVALPTPSMHLISRAISIHGKYLEQSPFVTVIQSQPQRPLTSVLVEKWIETQLESDDVFDREFLSGILIALPYKTNLSSEVLRTLESLGNKWTEVLVTDQTNLQGLYLLDSGEIRKIYRLYDDVNQSFMAGVAFTDESIIAVPSRADGSSIDKPLGGVRVAVKDIFDLKGIRRTACNRAYCSLSQPATGTAPSIQILLDHGATIVGTTKLSSMISREEPTEATDYQAPFNPRGDGYQSPAGSSSGGASAIASYDWIDITVGTDSTGSSRRPALVNGCFQLRVTQDLLPLDRLMPCFPIFDAPAFFGRDLQRLKEFGRIWLNRPENSCHKVTDVILYPLDYLPVSSDAQMEIINRFVADLSRSSGAVIKKLSINDEWARSPPREANGVPLRIFLDNVGKNSFFYDFTESTKDFRERYELEHQKMPYVTNVVRWRWTIGEQITTQEREDAVKRLEIYKIWLLETIFDSKRQLAVMVLPIAEVEPNYRDIPPGAPFAQEAWDPLFLAPVIGGPEVTIPVGEIPYRSRISAREEMLPVAVSVLGPPKSDIDLLDLSVDCLEESGRSLVVSTGRNMFTPTSSSDLS